MESIGFIGLGIMGRPMARNLLKAGYALTVHNRSKGPVEELAAEGGAPASSPREVAERSDVIITMLPDSPDVEEVVLGRGGVREGVRPGALFIDMSTVAPATARKVHRELAGAKVQSLDAPVSGGEAGAKAGTLSIMVGGEEEAFRRAMPVFQTLGKNILLVGGPGAGQVTKACNQVVVALTIQAVAEALAMARKAGVDPAKVREALLGGFAQSRILDVHGKRMLDRDFVPGFKTRLHRKDLGIALQTAREHGVPLLGTAQIAQMMDALIAQGMGDMDHSILYLLEERLANAEPWPGARP
ncbi:MAG: 2-hydroxy-3-oxopropionate reductase [Thermodesulfobacteriota bacterium]